MTEYTADDFQHARFAKSPLGHNSACRADSEDGGTWICPAWPNDTMSDWYMARNGWVPVQEKAGSYTRTTSPELLDGGVTSALIEKEADAAYTRTDEKGDPRKTVEFWKGAANVAKRRAEKAEKERDALREENTKGREHGTEVRTAAGLTYLATVEELADTVRNLRLRAAQPHPLTPDDITDEMRDRARKALRGHGIFGSLVPKIVDGVLTAALTEPIRPEGAEAVSSVLGALRDGDGEWMTYASDEDLDGLADAMAERGVRVTGADS